MKKSQLKQLVKEELKKIKLNEKWHKSPKNNKTILLVSGDFKDKKTWKYLLDTFSIPYDNDYMPTSLMVDTKKISYEL